MFSYLEQLVKYACYLQIKHQLPIFLNYFTASLLQDLSKSRIDSSMNDQKSFLPANDFACRKLHEQLEAQHLVHKLIHIEKKSWMEIRELLQRYFPFWSTFRINAGSKGV